MDVTTIRNNIARVKESVTTKTKSLNPIHYVIFDDRMVKNPQDNKEYSMNKDVYPYLCGVFQTTSSKALAEIFYLLTLDYVDNLKASQQKVKPKE